MDRVAFDFRRRVAALWKCCDSGYHYDGCLHALVPDCEWTMKSKKQRIDFVIGEENGEWSYRFTNPDWTEGAKGYLSMDELKKNPNWKHIRIQRIEVSTANRISMHPLRSRADIERLLNFVVFLSNEPHLALYTWNVKVFDSLEGATFLKCFSKMTFSKIWISVCFPVFNQLLENQFARRIPTEMDITRVHHNRKFFIEHLGNGNIKKFHGPFNFRFRAKVMKRIINRFLENPEFYDKKELFIEAEFEESTKKMLERKLNKGRCEKVAHGTYSTKYRFTATNPKLEENLCLSITFSADGSIIFISID